MAELNELFEKLNTYKNLTRDRKYGDPYNDPTIPRDEFGRALDTPTPEEEFDPIKELRDAQKEEKENQETIKLEKEMRKTQDMLMDLNKNGIPDHLEKPDNLISKEPTEGYQSMSLEDIGKSVANVGRGPAAHTKAQENIPFDIDQLNNKTLEKKEVLKKRKKKRFIDKYRPKITNFNDFREAMGMLESRGRWSAVNNLGFKGKYQMGDTALVDAGYKKENKDKDIYSDPSKYTWTGKGDVNTLAGYLTSPEEQNKAFSRYTDRNRITLKKGSYNKKKKKIYDGAEKYIGKRFVETDDTITIGPENDRRKVNKIKFVDKGSPEYENAIEINRLGLLAAAHLRGATGVNKAFEKKYNDIDANKTSLIDYMKIFEGQSIDDRYQDKKKYYDGGVVPTYPTDEPTLSPQIPYGTDMYPGKTQRLTPDERAVYESLAKNEAIPEYLEQKHRQPIVEPPTEEEILGEQQYKQPIVEPLVEEETLSEETFKTRESEPKETVESRKPASLDLLEQYRQLKERERETKSKKTKAAVLTQLMANLGRAGEVMYEGIPGVKPQYKHYEQLQKQASKLADTLTEEDEDKTKDDKPRYQQSDWIDDKGNPLTFDKFTGKLYTTDKSGNVTEYTGTKTRKISNLHKDKEGRRYRYHPDGRIEYIDKQSTDKYAYWSDMTSEQQKYMATLGKEYRKEIEPIRTFESVLDSASDFVKADIDATYDAIKRQLARTIGMEKGVMTDADVKAFGGAKSVIDKMANFISLTLHGQPTDHVRDNYLAMIKVAKRNIKKKRTLLQNDFIAPAMFRLGDKADVAFIENALGFNRQKIKGKLSKVNKENLIEQAMRKNPNVDRNIIEAALKKKFKGRW